MWSQNWEPAKATMATAAAWSVAAPVTLTHVFSLPSPAGVQVSQAASNLVPSPLQSSPSYV